MRWFCIVRVLVNVYVDTYEVIFTVSIDREHRLEGGYLTSGKTMKIRWPRVDRVGFYTSHARFDKRNSDLDDS